MIQKVLTFSILLIIYFVWYIILLIKKKSKNHLFLSFVISCIPFQMSIPVFIPDYQTGSGTGTFTSKIFLMIPLVSSIILLLTKRNKNLHYIYKNEQWILWIFLLILISLINPYNHAIWATLAFALLFISYIIFFKLIYNSLNPIEVLNGIFTSFLFLCVLQFILAILFPLLNISFVTTIFQTGGEDWATRNGTRLGAIGVFVTPANLGLFTTIASGFFLATFLDSFKKRNSLILLIINSITIFLTYSRTSYITLVFILFTIFYIHKNPKKPLFSLKSLFLGIAPAILFLYWLVFFSPLSGTFLKTNADEMFQARLDHWLIGLEIFKSSPIIGVGINTHLEYINQTASLYKQIHNEFLTTNPIHSTHLIVLAETGIIGFLLWIIFLRFSVVQAKFNIANNNNVILSLTQIAIVVTYIIYGFTDWAPLSQSIFPMFLLFTFFSNKYSIKI